MALNGVLNGTDVKLAIDSADDQTFTDIGGLITYGFTLNNGAIDLTNKSSASFREIMDREGLQSLDLTAEVIFSSDAAFKAVKDAAFNKQIKDYQVARNGEVVACAAYITSFAETAPDNDKLTASISLQSSGPITESSS